MSKTLARGLAAIVAGLTAPMKPYRRATTRALVAERLAQRITVATAAGPITLETPSARAMHDPWQLYENEPETIRWLDRLPRGDTVWDIGANIGVYTVYAAARGLAVLAFEPSAASYAVLVRNIELNRFDDRVAAYCLAFDATTRLDRLQMANTEAGHSAHAFGAGRQPDGAAPARFRQSVPGFAIDEFCALFHPAPPAHIKLNVDGIEPDILKGAAVTLAAAVETLLVEIERPEAGRVIREFLAGLGFCEDAAFAAEGARRNVLFRRRLGGDP